MTPDQLRTELAQVEYMLTPEYAVYMTADNKVRARMFAHMIHAELMRRGLDVS